MRFRKDFSVCIGLARIHACTSSELDPRRPTANSYAEWSSKDRLLNALRLLWLMGLGKYHIKNNPSNIALKKCECIFLLQILHL